MYEENKGKNGYAFAVAWRVWRGNSAGDDPFGLRKGWSLYLTTPWRQWNFDFGQ